MKRNQPQPGPPWRTVLLTGAAMGAGLTLAYGLAFGIYATLRSSVTVLVNTPPEIGVVPTLAANGASILIPALASALVVTPVMALIGLVTAGVVQGLLQFNRGRQPERAILIGFGATLAIVLLYQLPLVRLLRQTMPGAGLATYWFWFGFPALIQLGAGVVGAWQLNRRQPNGSPQIGEVRWAEQTAL
jgi:hypothetical protein